MRFFFFFNECASIHDSLYTSTPIPRQDKASTDDPPLCWNAGGSWQRSTGSGVGEVTQVIKCLGVWLYFFQIYLRLCSFLGLGGLRDEMHGVGLIRR